MLAALQFLLYLIGLPLEAMVVWTITRSGAWRRFPFIFAYAVALLLASLVEVPAYFAHFAGVRRGHSRAFYYWINEGVLQMLMFAAVISLVYVATESLRKRLLIRRVLVAGAVLFSPVSLGLHYRAGVPVSEWMTLLSRDFNLCTAVLDLALWMILLAFRSRDHRLLLLSGGLGIQFSGEAIGHSLRQLSRATVLLGSVCVVVANLVCLYVWWQAFRAPEEDTAGRVGAQPAA